MDRHYPAGAMAATDGQLLTAVARPVGQLERLPKCLNLVPMVIQWLWLAIRYRSVTLPSTANPAILAGGLVGEGKADYFATMGLRALATVARFTTIINEGAGGLSAAKLAMVDAMLAFPVIAKPDIGWCGFGVRLIRSDAELTTYLERFPRGERIILQRFLPQDGEAGIFYVRMPGATKGRLIGILLRHFPRIVGDGVRSVAELIDASPRLHRLGRDGLSEACCDTSAIPAAGLVVRISTIGSTRVGGLYEDGSDLITPALTDAIDAIAQDMTEFHIGRFDVRFDSAAALACGTGFTIIEVNGAGSEAVHAWDPKFSLRQAYAIVFAKQRVLFAIGHAMRCRGHRPVGISKLTQMFLRQHRLIGRYPPSN